MTSRRAWRSWLAKNHDRESEIWLVCERKSTGRPRLSYNAAVEEAHCYGWIDSNVMRVDEERFAQRFSVRKKRSGLSQMNRERVRDLIKRRKMTRAGLTAIAHVFDPTTDRAERSVLAPDIRRALHADERAFRHFQRFPARYRRIRIAYIEHARARGRQESQRRLRHFVKMTAQGKRIGFVREMAR